jgi:hypothetical protein
VNIHNGQITVDISPTIGSLSGAGTLKLNGASLTLTQNVEMSVGGLDLSNGALVNADGGIETGNLTMQGSTVTTPAIFLLGPFSASATANIIGSTLNAALNLAGTLTLDTSTVVSAGPVGTLFLNGASSITGSTYSGIISVDAGTLDISGASTISSPELALGVESTGTMNLKGGQFTADSELIGIDGTGSVEHTAGKNLVNGTLTLGSAPNGYGTYDLQTTGTQLYSLIAGDEVIGDAGTGFFTHTFSAGAINSTGTLTLGSLATGNGTYLLGDQNGVLLAVAEVVGDSGKGFLSQSNGTSQVSGTLTLGQSSGGDGTYKLTGGTLTANTEIVGGDGSGLFTQKGGSNTVGGNLCISSVGKGLA